MRSLPGAGYNVPSTDDAAEPQNRLLYAPGVSPTTGQCVCQTRAVE